MTGTILSKIATPQDIKTLSFSDLKNLCEEIRQRIIEVLANTGGHLASNLGIVELTVALHKVFDSPSDKLIWDVSHQTYVHKLLTGRNERFPTIRQHKGLCGFSNPQESNYDHFFAGHAGTALSLSLGVAKNRDLSNKKDYVIPIIGDATLTCGMVHEALNNISRNLKRFIVILNDNNMSISKNVGAVTQILSRMLSNPTTNRLHQEVDALLSKIPGYGAALSQKGHKLTESLKNLFSPAAFFEQYELTYIGPVDGHDVKKLVHTLESLKNSNWPVILHVITKKGQGMTEAIKNPVSYHGAKPFCIETGKFHTSSKSTQTFPKVFGNHLLHMAEKDNDVVCITPAMSAGSCLDSMMNKYPERCIDVGIAESHAVTFSGGVAYGQNKKVFSSIYSTFLQRGFDNLFHDVCIQELPVVFAIDRAGIASGDGITHHGIYDISFLNAMPNMVIAQPRDGHVLKELLESAHSWKRPTAIRYPNIQTHVPQKPLQKRELGKGEILASGKELLILSLGHMNTLAFEVRDILEKEGILATIMDPVFVKPLDSELIVELLLSHSFIVTIEEHSVVSGLGAIVNHFLMTNGYSDIKVCNFGIPETFLHQGDYQKILKDVGLTAENISRKLLHTLLPQKINQT